MLLQERRLLGAELDHLLGVLTLEREPALVARAQALVVEDLLDGDRREASALQRQERLEPVAAIGWMQQRQGLDPRHHLGRRRHRVTLGDRRQILEAIRNNPICCSNKKIHIELGIIKHQRAIADELEKPSSCPRALRLRTSACHW
jgi:hypothetical protein